MIRKALDRFFYFRKGLTTSIAYASLWLYGSEVQWRDLWNQAFPPSSPVNYDLTKVGSLDLVLAAAKEAMTVAEARQSSITEKCKTLLTASSLLIAVVGVLLPKTFVFSPTWIQIAFFLAALALLNTVILLLELLSVRAATVVSYDQAEIELGPDQFKKSAIQAYFTCQVHTDSSTDYVVEVYKGARFSFLSALTIIVILFSATFFLKSAQKEADLVAHQLRADPIFLRSIRGEKGEMGRAGDQGPRGDLGPRGDRGVDGNQGPPGSVNEDAIVDRVLQDPRFKRSEKSPPPQ